MTSMIKRLFSDLIVLISISREADKSRCDERDIDTGTPDTETRAKC